MRLFSFRRWGMCLLLVTVGLLTVYPLSMIIYGSLRSAAPGFPGFFTFNGYIQAYSDPTIIKALYNTFSLGIVRTFITMAIAMFVCWIIVRTDTPFKGALEILMWINFFIPGIPMAMAWILLMDPTYGLFNQWLMKLPLIDGPLFNIFSYWGIIWVHIAHSTSIKVLVFAPAFRNMDAALEDSARMSGASNIATMLRITFPILLPAIAGATMLGFVKSLEAFGVEFILGTPVRLYVFSTKVYELLSWDPPRYPPAMALSTVFMAVVMAMVVLNRWIIQRREYTTVTGKGYRTTPLRLGKWRYATLAFVILYAFIFLVLPFSMLVIGTFMKVSGMFHLPNPYTLTHWKTILGDHTFISSAVNSLIVGLFAALGGVTFFSFISYISVRTKLPGRNLLDFMTWLPWSVPGLLLAVGLLWAVLGGLSIFKVLYGTIFILIIAIIIKELPIGVRIMDGTMVQINRELEESARVFGASWLQTFRSIMVPLLIPSYVSAAVIIFLAALRDIEIIVLLYSPQSRVLSILMLEHYIGMSPEKGMVVGLIITITCIAVAIATRTLGVSLRTGE